MTRIVVYVHRPKRPPKKTKADVAPIKRAAEPVLTVVVTASPKQLKRLRAERWFAKPREPTPEVEAFFAHNVRPRGPLPPER
jgi:hypothetical protein